MGEIIDISSIKSDNQRVITKTYDRYKPEFLAFARNNYGMERYEAEDAYQDALFAVYQNIRDGKLTNLTVTFKTYLFSIGKNKIVDNFRKTQNEIELERFPDVFSDDDQMFNSIYYEAESIDEKKQMLVYRSVTQMGDPCKTILYSFYYEEKSMNDIAKSFNYSSSDVAKQQKARCMKKITAIINERFKQEKLI